MSTTAAPDIAEIIRLGCPVLFPDTCFLLDIVRDPTRDVVRPADRVAAVQIADALSASRIVCCVAKQVDIELAEHRQAVEDEAAKAIHVLTQRLERMDRVLAAYGGEGTSVIAHLHDHGVRAHALLDRVLAASQPTDQSADIAERALLRVNQARTPARKGSAAMKDCVVIETYLDFASRSRNAGLTSPIVFASSNTKDYSETSGSSLKGDLASECAALDIVYAPNFGAAKHWLGL